MKRFLGNGARASWKLAPRENGKLAACPTVGRALPFDFGGGAGLGDEAVPQLGGEPADHGRADVFQAQGARTDFGHRVEMHAERRAEGLADFAFLEREDDAADVGRHRAAKREVADVAPFGGTGCFRITAGRVGERNLAGEDLRTQAGELVLGLFGFAGRIGRGDFQKDLARADFGAVVLGAVFSNSARSIDCVTTRPRW